MRRTALALALAAALGGCAVTRHAVAPSPLGTPRPAAALLAVVDEPGPLVVETVKSADWKVELSGLLNLDHPAAEAAGLEDRREPIEIDFHVIRHPTMGTFVVDTGVERAYRDAPDEVAAGSLLRSFMHLEDLVVHVALADFLAGEKAPLAGVLFTHLHFDHIMGVPDLPDDVPLYAGPGEAAASGFLNLFVQGTTDRSLDGKGPLREWPFAKEEGAPLDAVVDVLGDGSLWAIWVPGHTEGSTAYLARTADGPVLLVGDTCHTAWGWEHGVEPGSFTADQARNAESLARLRALAAAHPRMKVRLGHQPLPAR